MAQKQKKVDALVVLRLCNGALVISLSESKWHIAATPLARLLFLSLSTQISRLRFISHFLRSANIITFCRLSCFCFVFSRENRSRSRVDDANWSDYYHISRGCAQTGAGWRQSVPRSCVQDGVGKGEEVKKKNDMMYSIYNGVIVYMMRCAQDTDIYSGVVFSSSSSSHARYLLESHYSRGSIPFSIPYSMKHHRA